MRCHGTRSPAKAADKKKHNFEGADFHLFTSERKKKRLNLDPLVSTREKREERERRERRERERRERVLVNYLADHERILLKEIKRIFSERESKYHSD